jgi:hypothetical protein
MENSLRELSFTSFNKMFEYVDSFIPERVEIVSIYQVTNHYKANKE